jgi:hypothetical protein
MGWVRPAAKNATKLGVKYGPHVVAAWKIGGKHVTAAAQGAMDSYSARRAAIQHAEIVVDGSLLRTMHAGMTIWVVFSGDKPVQAYPEAPVALDTLIADADLGKRLTPDQVHQQAAAARARRAARSVPTSVTALVRRRRHRPHTPRQVGDSTS